MFSQVGNFEFLELGAEEGVVAVVVILEEEASCFGQLVGEMALEGLE